MSSWYVGDLVFMIWMVAMRCEYGKDTDTDGDFFLKKRRIIYIKDKHNCTHQHQNWC